MGEFAKWAAQAEQEIPRPPVEDWRERASKQVEQFREVMPLSSEEGSQNAMRTLEELYRKLFGLGYSFRMRRHLESPEETTRLLPEGDPGIPGHDVSISLPKAASWVEPRLFSKEAIGPIQAMIQNKEVEGKAKLKEKKRRAFAHTTDPMTQPFFAPAMAITVPEAFRKGFTQADLDATTVRNEILSAELAKAKAEFEQALAEEYHGQKAASAGEWVDGLAKGLLGLEKQGIEEEPGLGMKALNTYLALAALLGYGAHRASESFVSKRESGAQKQKLYRMALRQRMHDKGIPVLVDYNELPAAQGIGPTDELPVPEAKEAMWTFLKHAPGRLKPMTAAMAGYPRKRIGGLVTPIAIPKAPVLSAAEIERLKILAENARVLQDWTRKVRAGGILAPVTTHVE